MRRLLLLLALLGCGRNRMDAITPFDKSDQGHQTGHFQMEALTRGVVAVKVPGGVYVGWRLFGYEYDPLNPTAVSFNLYRDGKHLASVADSTNYLDPAGTIHSTYSVRPVVGGVEGEDSGQARVLAQNYLRVPVQPPPAGVTPGSPQCDPPSEGYSYQADDGSPGDLDGDGEYEIVLKWMPSNARSNATSGCTGNVYLDAYKQDGRRLWRIDLGVNIRAGAHYTQFVVYDLDGDGKAEVGVKTAPGTRDGTGAFLHLGPAANDDDQADYRSVANPAGSTGHIVTGPEYLTVFAGPTGAELATVNFDPPRTDASGAAMPDLYLATAAFVSDTGAGQTASGRPSLIMLRGSDRIALTAWNWRDGALTQVWKADSDAQTAYANQSAGSLAAADVDGDGAQELVLGSSTIDSTGTRLCSTNLGYGDALHVGDLIPSRPGLEVFLPHQPTNQPSFDVHDARTCEVITRGPVTGDETWRGVADDVSPDNPGAELWVVRNNNLLAASDGHPVGPVPKSFNFLMWWDSDESRDLEDGTEISRVDGTTLQSCAACATNGGSKSTPVLTADLFGDWREEIIWRETDNTGLRIYTTTALTTRRLYTLMHDPQYRMQVSAEQTGFNQPPHPGFHIGNGMAAPPRPDIHVR